MRTTKQRIIRLALAGAIASTAFVSCGLKDTDAYSAEQTEDRDAVAALSAEEIKAIGEKGYIYGLPVVMAYSVMYEWAVDKDSGQWKAPFNEIYNEHRTFTYKDTSVVTPTHRPHSPAQAPKQST